jgi:hypothetical protein
MAYSKPVQTPPATVTPGNPPAPPVKPDSRKAKPVKRDLASPRQCHAAPSPWRYPPCQRNRPPPARNLGDLARVPSARQTAPPALMFFAPVLSASPPVRGNYETFSPSRIHLYPPSRGITTMTTHSCTGWRVIEHASTGRFIHTFDDEFLAIKFAVSIGSQAEPFTLSF